MVGDRLLEHSCLLGGRGWVREFPAHVPPFVIRAVAALGSVAQRHPALPQTLVRFRQRARAQDASMPHRACRMPSMRLRACLMMVSGRLDIPLYFSSSDINTNARIIDTQGQPAATLASSFTASASDLCLWSITSSSASACKTCWRATSPATPAVPSPSCSSPGRAACRRAVRRQAPLLVLDFTGTKRMFGLCTASQIGRGVGRVVLAALAADSVRRDQLRCHQPHRVAVGQEQPAQSSRPSTPRCRWCTAAAPATSARGLARATWAGAAAPCLRHRRHARRRRSWPDRCQRSEWS